MEIESDRMIPESVIGKRSADGYVDGPSAEIDADASYTIGSQINGRWYRWTGQRPEIVGDRARFKLRDGTSIAAPTNMAES